MKSSRNQIESNERFPTSWDGFEMSSSRAAFEGEKKNGRAPLGSTSAFTRSVDPSQRGRPETKTQQQQQQQPAERSPRVST